MQELGDFWFPTVSSLGASAGNGRVRRLLTDNELYEDAPAGWRRVRTTDAAPAMWQGVAWVISTGNTLSAVSLPNTVIGTLTTLWPSTASYRTQWLRTGCVTGATAGTTVGWRGNNNDRWRGNAPGLGGFELVCRFALTLLAGHQFFVGLSPTAQLAGDPSTTLTNLVGIGCDAADSNLMFMARGASGAATKTDTGVSTGIADMLRLRLAADPGAATISAQLISESANTVLASTTLSSTLPDSSTFLAPSVQVRNGAVTTSAVLEFVRLVINSPVR